MEERRTSPKLEPQMPKQKRRRRNVTEFQSSRESSARPPIKRSSRKEGGRMEGGDAAERHLFPVSRDDSAAKLNSRRRTPEVEGQ